MYVEICKKVTILFVEISLLVSHVKKYTSKKDWT